MNMGEVIGGVIVLLFGALTIVFSLQLPIGTFRMAGSGLFPMWLGIVLILLSLLHLGKLRLKGGSRLEGKQKAEPPSEATKQMLLFLGASVLATVCLDIFGFPLTAFLLMLLLLRILGVRGPAMLVAMPLLTALAAYFLFVQFLKIPLPKGVIGL
ncbi:MAG: tripartite tricarboxylate transporter TctB family protein [Deltaproteobacteria bacterium]|nr:tripartite tricarboxylate transporter TctB family protein [Deltaproteobacteria bacterium]